jgi:hypothetical protein
VYVDATKRANSTDPPFTGRVAAAWRYEVVLLRIGHPVDFMEGKHRIYIGKSNQRIYGFLGQTGRREAGSPSSEIPKADSPTISKPWSSFRQGGSAAQATPIPTKQRRKRLPV